MRAVRPNRPGSIEITTTMKNKTTKYIALILCIVLSLCCLCS